MSCLHWQQAASPDSMYRSKAGRTTYNGSSTEARDAVGTNAQRSNRDLRQPAMSRRSPVSAFRRRATASLS